MGTEIAAKCSSAHEAEGLVVGFPALATRFPDAEVIALAPDTGFGQGFAFGAIGLGNQPSHPTLFVDVGGLS